MNWWTLIWANSARKPIRTVLTYLSLTIAFLLFMLLRAVAGAFDGNGSAAGLDRLVVDSKYSLTDNLPLAHVEKIRALEQIDQVTHVTWFSGVYQDPKNAFTKFPVEPEAFFDISRELVIAPEHLERFIATRTGAVASTALAQQYGWEIGDRIPIDSDLTPRKDGENLWTFDLVGTFDYRQGSGQPLFLFQYAYYNEAIAWGQGQVGFLDVRVKSPEQIGAAISAIDNLFENSAYPTRSTPRDEYLRQFARQIGDIGTITSMILGAVFFTIVLMTANTLLQSFRERMAELATMKTLGFADSSLGALVLLESTALCVLGCLSGIGLALLLEETLNQNLSTIIGTFNMGVEQSLTALVLAATLGIGVGAYPAIATSQLKIVNALRTSE